ncbi:hypothetical protein JD844_026160 [Phrynosoma platyrhinos]|uniref:Caspase recruitment domain-containing protein n=1 Tax=Phrynosoma platyrhinos TaxID=52577 RepID=A0ABQ7SEJ0_PHRPL|nr:hypothetical protein JD844_026160 [Phrynosoma platyrhinos]
MSSFAEEKVKKYIRRNLTKFYRIRVAQMLHLPCLTDTDRQEISAFCSRHGNNLAVLEFFERLQSRDGWLRELIEAVREDNLGDLADDLQRVYDMYALPVSPDNAPPSSSPPLVKEALPASAEQNPLPPCNPQRSRGTQSPAHLPPASPRLASSTTKPDLAEMSDYHAPVQETDLPSQNNGTMAEPKSIVTSPFNPRAQKEKPSNSQPSSATSESPAILKQGHLGEMSGTPSPAPSRSDFSDLTPKWGGPQRRPVCVKSGYFGNMSRVAGDNVASPIPVAYPGPNTSRNQPVEDHYSSSSDNFPAAAPNSQDDSQEENQLVQRKTLIQWGSQQKPAFHDPVQADSSSTTSKLQRQLGVGQGIPNQWKNSPDGRIHKNAASSGHSNVRLGSSFYNHSQPPWSPSENVSASPNPTAVPLRHPLSDFEGSSSTDVIPPSSRGDLEDLKPPIQEEKLPVGDLDDSHTSVLVQERVSVTQPLDVVDGSTVNSVRRRNGSSRNNRVFYSNCDDDIPCKPGILTSGVDVTSLQQLQSGQETNPEYSGRSDRLCLSSEFSLSGDSLKLSDSSQTGQPEEKSSNSAVGTVLGKTVMSKGGSASFQAMNDNQEVSGSIRSFAFQVEEDASINLAGAPNTIGYQGCQPNQSPGAYPHLATGHQPSTPDDCHQKKGADPTPPWTPSDTLLLVGFILAAVAGIAFVLYKKK